MSSRRRSQGKPIESVQLKVTFRADRKSLSKIKKAVPEATWRGGALEVDLEGAEPLKVAEETKKLSDKVRAALEGEGRGNQPGRRRDKKKSKRL